MFSLCESKYVVSKRNQSVDARSQHLSLEMPPHTKQPPPVQKLKAILPPKLHPPWYFSNPHIPCMHPTRFCSALVTSYMPKLAHFSAAITKLTDLAKLSWISELDFVVQSVCHKHPPASLTPNFATILAVSSCCVFVNS